MIRMICEECRTVYYSAAARTMVEQGQKCAKCGGRLVLDEEEPEPSPRRAESKGSLRGGKR